MRTQLGQMCSRLSLSVEPQKTQARGVLSWSVADKRSEPTQKTQPKKGKPIEIPVLKRADFDRLLAKAGKKSKQR